MPSIKQTPQHLHCIAAQSRIFKALGHPTRLLMVDALLRGERCVCELQQLVGSDMSTVSKHLSVLRQAGVVTMQKRGTSVYYSLAICCLEQFLVCTRDVVRRNAREQAALLESQQ